MALNVEVAGKSHIGCVRQNNEDSFGYDAQRGIFIVCDGMGGMAAGEVASKMAVDTVLGYFRQANSNGGSYPLIGKQLENVSERANILSSAIQAANHAVHEAAERDTSRAGMGSTVVAVLLEGGACSIAHVGDSRVYLVRDGAIQQLTDDHSLVMEQVRRGIITLEEAQSSEMQNIIIRALGTESEVQPDVNDLKALPGDVLLLCSDGLTRHVPDPDLLEIIKASPNLEQACDSLIHAANEAGGSDNVTCLLLRIVQQPWYRRLALF